MLRPTEITLPYLTIVMIAGGVLGAFFAGQKNRDQVIWALAAALSPMIALVALACFPHLGEMSEREAKRSETTESIWKYAILAWGCLKVYQWDAYAPLVEPMFFYFTFREWFRPKGPPLPPGVG